jgi:hypothetical protein
MDQHTVDILKREVKAYAGEGLNGMSYFTQSEDGTVFSVVGISFMPGETWADAALIARIDGEHIIIELDISDKPLVDALTQAGIPRDRVVLAYAGEKLPADVAPLPGEHLADRR